MLDRVSGIISTNIHKLFLGSLCHTLLYTHEHILNITDILYLVFIIGKKRLKRFCEVKTETQNRKEMRGRTISFSYIHGKLPF